jgi:hypothetical protein
MGKREIRGKIYGNICVEIYKEKSAKRYGNM